jgi:LysR family transcriptional regulator, glycine cleavage system transcriptional activator
LTPGALSHGIDSLEQWLDVELFETKARGVILTPAGRQFLPDVSEALSMIATGTLRLPSRRFEDRLSISATGLFSYKLLLPRLHKFREMYPNMVGRWMPPAVSSNCLRINSISLSGPAVSRGLNFPATCSVA